MGQNATQILVRSAPIAMASAGFAEFFTDRFATALARQLGLDVALGLHRHTQPRDATLRNQLLKPQLLAALPQSGNTTAFLCAAESLARQIVAARLGARLGDRPLSAIDLALAAVLPEQVQLTLAQWQPTRPLPAGLLQFGPLEPGPQADWHSFEFTIALGNQRPSRLRLFISAHLSQPPRAPSRRPALSPRLNPVILANALNTAPLPLRAVLHRQLMGRQQLAGFRLGDWIELPANCLNSLTIELCIPPATSLAQARLGAFDGHKMLKLCEAPDPAHLSLSAK